MGEKYGTRRRRSRLASLVALTLLVPLVASGQPQDIVGVIVGRVYEIDETKYEKYRKDLEARQEDSDVEPEPV